MAERSPAALLSLPPTALLAPGATAADSAGVLAGSAAGRRVDAVVCVYADDSRLLHCGTYSPGECSQQQQQQPVTAMAAFEEEATEEEKKRCRLYVQPTTTVACCLPATQRPMPIGAAFIQKKADGAAMDTEAAAAAALFVRAGAQQSNGGEADSQTVSCSSTCRPSVTRRWLYAQARNASADLKSIGGKEV